MPRPDIDTSPAADAISVPSGDSASTVRASSSQAPSPPVIEQPPSFDADYLHNPAPQYPAQSRRLRQEGLTSLRVHVSATGEPDSVQIYQSSGFDALDTAALDAVRGWRFAPATAAGHPVAGWVIVPIRFSLRSGSK